MTDPTPTPAPKPNSHWLPIILMIVVGSLLLFGLPGGGLLSSSPVPGKGLHVLYVEDKHARESLTNDQMDAIQSASLDALIEKAGGKKYDLHFTDDPANTGDDWLIKAMKFMADKPREDLPYFVIDRDGTGGSGKLGSFDEHVKLIEKYTQ